MVNDLSNLWRSNVGSDGLFHIPYEFSSTRSRFVAADRAIIENALQELSDEVGIINIRKRVASDPEYITITDNEDGCWSYVGRIEGKSQQLNLAPGCVTKDTVQHEYIHALGFKHEQSRSDRDNYVTIKYENILERAIYNFDKVDPTFYDSQGSTYDYGSVMHYGAYDFSKNKLKTIDAGDNIIGMALKASKSDIDQIRMLYQCKSKINTFASYSSSPCSADCKCNIGMQGCVGNNDFCHGDLVCSNNQCSLSSGGALLERVIPTLPATLFLNWFPAFIVVSSITQIRLIDAIHRSLG
jgi:hypothetical protein